MIEYVDISDSLGSAHRYVPAEETRDCGLAELCPRQGHTLLAGNSARAFSAVRCIPPAAVGQSAGTCGPLSHAGKSGKTKETMYLERITFRPIRSPETTAGKPDTPRISSVFVGHRYVPVHKGLSSEFVVQVNQVGRQSRRRGAGEEEERCEGRNAGEWLRGAAPPRDAAAVCWPVGRRQPQELRDSKGFSAVGGQELSTEVSAPPSCWRFSWVRTLRPADGPLQTSALHRRATWSHRTGRECRALSRGGIWSRILVVAGAPTMAHGSS